MKKLNKKDYIVNSIEAYQCTCRACSSACGCSCSPIAEYQSGYSAVRNYKEFTSFQAGANMSTS